MLSKVGLMVPDLCSIILMRAMNIHTFDGEFNLKTSMSAIQSSDYTGQKNGCAYRKIPQERGFWGISQHVHYMSHSHDIMRCLIYTWDISTILG